MNAAGHGPGQGGPGSHEVLLARADTARAHAYAPYSGFAVGAAVAAADGRVFAGVNVENASYPAGLCAERAALAAAILAGVRDLVVLAVVGSGPGPTPPCGLCRQAFFEFAPALRVLTAGRGGQPVAEYVLARDLLPSAFGPDTLAAGDARG